MQIVPWGTPVAPNPVTSNTFPLSRANVLFGISPVNISNALLAVHTNSLSKFFPPNSTAVTISAGMVITFTIFPVLKLQKKSVMSIICKFCVRLKTYVGSTTKTTPPW